MPGLLSGLAGGIAAVVATRDLYNGNRLYTFYPARTPQIGSPEYIEYNLNGTEYSAGGDGRTALVQGGYQILIICVTLGLAITSGIITGFIMKLRIFEQVKNEEMFFDDGDNWITPDNFENPTETSINLGKSE
jgi:hypothetical protein